MLAQCTPESLQLFQDACARSEAAGRTARPRARNHHPQEPGRIWVRIIGHLELLGRPPVPRLRSVQNVQAQKLAQIALEKQHRVAEALDEHGAHAAWRWDRPRDVFDVRRRRRPKKGHCPTCSPV